MDQVGCGKMGVPGSLKASRVWESACGVLSQPETKHVTSRSLPLRVKLYQIRSVAYSMLCLARVINDLLIYSLIALQ